MHLSSSAAADLNSYISVARVVGMLPILALISCGSYSTKLTEAWSCVVDFESQCYSNSCTAYGSKEDKFRKQVEANFDLNGVFSVCMYSGCFDGKGLVRADGPMLSISTQNTAWNGLDGTAANVFIVLDRTDNFGMFKANTFVQPIICKKA